MFYISTATDIGIKRENNQDSLFAKEYETKLGTVAFAVLCDGMGGLQHGEIASRSIVKAFVEWAERVLPRIDPNALEDCYIRQEWTSIVAEENEKLREYGQRNGCSIGSTLVTLLLTEKRYYILNIGDSRVYRIDDRVTQLTEDHTVIAEEIRKGNLSEEQALASPIKSVLTRCVGVSTHVYPDLFFGDTGRGTTYMLCSDGFRHKISKEEMAEHLLPSSNNIDLCMKTGIYTLIERNKARGETDNISVINVYVE